jgi:hypothetical protein
MTNDLDKVKKTLSTQAEVIDTLKSETAELSIKTTAQIKSRLEAYKQVYDNYEGFIIDLAKKLKDGQFGDNTYKELGASRLVANWLQETEEFLEENEKFLENVDKTMRQGFVRESLTELPEDTRKELINFLNEEKAQLLEKFAKKLQVALKKYRSG